MGLINNYKIDADQLLESIYQHHYTVFPEFDFKERNGKLQSTNKMRLRQTEGSKKGNVFWKKGYKTLVSYSEGTKGIYEYLMERENLEFYPLLLLLCKQLNIEVETTKYLTNKAPIKHLSKRTTTVMPETKKIDYLPFSYLQKTVYFLPEVPQNNFIKWLQTKYTNQQINQVIDKFWLGCSKYIAKRKDGKTNRWKEFKNGIIFWQIDMNQQVYDGQIMFYTPQGKREKFTDSEGNKQGVVSTVVHLLQKQNILPQSHNRKWFWFGIQQLIYAKQTTVCLVESPKTAILMSIELPQFTWIATCGLHNFEHKEWILNQFKDRIIIVFPDKGKACTYWKKCCTTYQQQGFKIKISELLEHYQPANNKDDLADMVY